MPISGTVGCRRWMLALVFVAVAGGEGATCGWAQPVAATAKGGESYQTAAQLAASGKHAEACDAYLQAIVADPAGLRGSFSQMLSTFRRTRRLPDLAQALQRVDLSAFEQSLYQLGNLVNELQRTQDTQAAGQNLFRKLWQDFPQRKSELLMNLADDSGDLFDYALELAIPREQPPPQPWQGIAESMSWDQDGRAISLMSRLLAAAQVPERRERLMADITAAAKRHPGWRGGETFAALLEARAGHTDAVEPLVTAMLQDANLPWTVALCVGQELADVESLRPQAIRLLERSLQAAANGSNFDFSYHPGRSLARTYAAVGERAKGRQLLLDLLAQRDYSQYASSNPGYGEYQDLWGLHAAGRDFLAMNMPLDALRMYEQAADPSKRQAASRWGGQWLERQLDEGRAAATAALTPEVLSAALSDWVQVDRQPAVDFALSVQPRTADAMAIVSLLETAISELPTLPGAEGKTGAASPVVVSFLQQLSGIEGADADLSVATVRLLVPLISPDEPITPQTAADLRELARRLKDRDDPQAAPAAWLVARRALRHPQQDIRLAGAELSEQVLAAAHKHPEPHWLLAMLRERGQLAIDAGDAATAGEHWAAMHERLLPPIKSPEPRSLGEVREALAVSRLAARHGLVDLSLRAVREALPAGSPQTAVANPLTAILRLGNTRPVESPQPYLNEVTRLMAELSDLWTQRAFPPSEVFTTLAAVVFPETRPQDLFLYTRTLENNETSAGHETGSIGELLVNWAARAEQLDDLRSRCRERAEFPRTRFAARWLLTRLDVQQQRTADVLQEFAALQEQVATLSPRDQIEAVGQLALIGLTEPPTRETAADLLQACAQRVMPEPTGNLSLEPAQTWWTAVATARLQLGQPEAARQAYQTLLTAQETIYQRYNNPEYAAQQRSRLIQQFATDLLRQGELVEAFHWIGQVAAGDAASDRFGALPLAPHLARQLITMSPRERYDFLYRWTVPEGQTPRTLTGFVPTVRPPEELTAALPERWRTQGFEILTTTSDPAVFHSGLALLDAARESGELPALITQLQQLSADPNAGAAAQLLWLHELRQGQPARLRTPLENRAEQLEAALTAASQGGPAVTAVPLDEFVVALEATSHPELRDVAERLLLVCLNYSKRLQQALPRVHIAAAYADALRRRDATADAATVQPPALRDWKPAVFSAASASGGDRNWWSAADGAIRNHLSDGETALLFRYPLTGDFAVHAFVSEGNWSEGGLLYGGLQFANYRHGNYVSLSAPGRSGGRSVPGHLLRDIGVDNRCTLAVQDGRLEYHINGHVMFTEAVGATSPWLGLRSTRGWTPAYRSWTWTGNPVIPREVLLLDDARLLGWSTATLGNRAPNPLAMPTTASASGLDWSCEQGELNGARRVIPAASTGTDATSTHSLIEYQRPLWNGEQIAYQFFCDPEAAHVHPTLDQVAFLLRPDGVRLRWLTAGAHSWLGLPAEHEVRVTEEPLPLKPGEWNDVVLAVADEHLTLTLNGTVVLQRPLSPHGTWQFGLTHQRDREEARVRQVVLSGDWPESLPDALRTNLFVAEREVTPAERGLARQLITEEMFAKEALTVVRRCAALPADQRWDELLAWVFPDFGSVPLRLHADFVAADDPLSAERFLPLVSPAGLLIETAAELQRLDELLAKIQTLPASASPYDQRALLAMTVATQMARGRTGEASLALVELGKLMPQVTTRVEWERWPEIVAGCAALPDPGVRVTATRLLEEVVLQIQRGQSSGWRFDGRIRGLRGLALALAMSSSEIRLAGGPESLWQPVSHGRADTVALGIPQPLWTQAPAGLNKWVGHEDDFLYYGIPLLGDFTVECELSGFSYREARLMYAGRRVGMYYDRKQVYFADFLTGLPNVPIGREVACPSGWIPYRLQVRGDRMTIDVGGQVIYDDALPTHRDPWLAIYSHVSNMSGMRHMRITGKPVIPEELPLTAGEGLHGWIATYYRDNAARGANPEWSQTGDTIQARLRPELKGTGREALLQYHRPLLEDGELRYRFQYVPGQSHVHPALGRTAFLLQPEGIALHRLTGGVWESTGLSPWNAEPLVGSGPLPLRENAENDVIVALQDATVTITLNGSVVYRGELEPGNNRLFGLFHYPGETGVQVRDVVYRGNWPRQLPPVSAQEFAHADANLLGASPTGYAQSLTHSFVRDGMGTGLFALNGATVKEHVQVTPAGLQMKTVGPAGYKDSQVALRRQVIGDFDIEADFENLQVEQLTAGSGGIGLQFLVRSQACEATRIGRRLRPNGEQFVEVLASHDSVDGTRRYPARELAGDALAGTFRAIRRGGLIHYFLRERGKSDWRYIDTVWIGEPDQPILTIVVQTSVTNAPGKTASVTWTGMRVHAEKISP
jgi:hypothetical protein